jgi:hypothetical protein
MLNVEVVKPLLSRERAKEAMRYGKKGTTLTGYHRTPFHLLNA